MSIQEFLDYFLPYNERIFSKDLFDKYKNWCLEFKHRPIIKVNFCKFLRNEGYEEKRIKIDKIRKNGFDFSKNIKVFPDNTLDLHYIALYDIQTNKVIHDIYNSKIESVEWRFFKHNKKVTHDFYGLHCTLDRATKCVKILNDTKCFDISTDIVTNIISVCCSNFLVRFNFCN